MSDEVARRLAKAEKLLFQAADLDAAAKTEAVVHLAYYARFHAAVALLIARTGTAPTRHRSVIGEFGRLLTSLGDRAKAHGKAINRAFDVRLLADYGVDERNLADVASKLLKDAKRLIAFSTRMSGARDRP